MSSNIPANWKEIIGVEYADGIGTAMNTLMARTFKIGGCITMISRSCEMSIDKITELLGFDPTLYHQNPTSITLSMLPGTSPDEFGRKLQSHVDRLDRNRIKDVDSVSIKTCALQIADNEYLLIIRMMLCGNAVTVNNISYLDNDYVVHMQYYRDEISDAAALFDDDVRQTDFGDLNPITNSALRFVLNLVHRNDPGLGERLQDSA
jgi:hypothetical protein